jgi:tetratricopeptide (TPR) repeat protein
MDEAVTRALSMRREDRIDEAIELLYDTLGDDFGNHEVIGVLASMLSETEQFERADRLFQRALQRGDVPTFVLLNYATFLSHSGRFTEAKPHYSNAAAHAVSDLQAVITTSGASGPAVGALEQLAIAECNLARTHLVLDDIRVAKALAEKWLVMESTWETAVDIVWACAERQGLDVDTEAANYHAARRASPDMVAELVHAAHERADPNKPFEALSIAAAGCAYLKFDWTAELEGLAEELEEMATPADAAVRAGNAPIGVRQDLQVLGKLLGHDWGRINPGVLAINAVLGTSMVVHADGGKPHQTNQAWTCCGDLAPFGIVVDERGSVSCDACVAAIEDAVAWQARVDSGEEPDYAGGPRSNSDNDLDRYYDDHMKYERRRPILEFWADRW